MDMVRHRLTQSAKLAQGGEYLRLVGISLGARDQDFEFRARFLRHGLDVRRLGTNGSTAKAVKLLRHWEKHADAIGLGVVKDNYTIGARHFVDAVRRAREGK